MILLIDGGEGFYSIATVLLAPFDVVIDRAADMATAVERLTDTRYQAVLIALPMAGVDEAAAAPMLRAASGNAECPIIALAFLDGGEGPWLSRGFDGLLATPFDATAFLAAIGGWLGRSDMDMPYDDAVGKLAPLMGEDAARGMVARVHASLAQAVEEIDAGGDKRALGHRLGGLAGTLGLTVLSAVWLTLQDDAEVWPTVRAITLEALSRHGDASLGA